MTRVGEKESHEKRGQGESEWISATFTEAPANMGILRVILSRSRDKGDVMLKYSRLVIFPRTSTCMHFHMHTYTLSFILSWIIYVITKDVSKNCASE